LPDAMLRPSRGSDARSTPDTGRCFAPTDGHAPQDVAPDLREIDGRMQGKHQRVLRSRSADHANHDYARGRFGVPRLNRRRDTSDMRGRNPWHREVHPLAIWAGEFSG
jgi:hypothetical protein